MSRVGSASVENPENLDHCCDTLRFRAHRSVVAVRVEYSHSKRARQPRARPIPMPIEHAIAVPKRGTAGAGPPFKTNYNTPIAVDRTTFGRTETASSRGGRGWGGPLPSRIQFSLVNLNSRPPSSCHETTRR